MSASCKGSMLKRLVHENHSVSRPMYLYTANESRRTNRHLSDRRTIDVLNIFQLFILNYVYLALCRSRCEFVGSQSILSRANAAAFSLNSTAAVSSYHPRDILVDMPRYPRYENATRMSGVSGDFPVQLATRLTD